MACVSGTTPTIVPRRVARKETARRCRPKEQQEDTEKMKRRGKEEVRKNAVRKGRLGGVGRSQIASGADREKALCKAILKRERSEAESPIKREIPGRLENS